MIKINIQKLKDILKEFEEKKDLMSIKDTFENNDILEVVRQ